MGAECGSFGVFWLRELPLLSSMKESRSESLIAVRRFGDERPIGPQAFTPAGSNLGGTVGLRSQERRRLPAFVLFVAFVVVATEASLPAKSALLVGSSLRSQSWYLSSLR